MIDDRERLALLVAAREVGLGALTLGLGALTWSRQPPHRRGVKEPHVHSRAFQVQPQHGAGETAQHWLDRNVLALNQAEPLKRRFEVIFGRIKEKILGDLQDVAIEDRFLPLVLTAG